MIENAAQANKSINRLKTIDAEIQILKSKINDQIEVFNNEAELIKNELKEYYYSLSDVDKVETKTLIFHKLQGGRLLERKQEPEFVRDEKVLIDWANRTGNSDFIKIKTIENFDWINLKKQVEVKENQVIFDDLVVEGVIVKEREPKFEVEVD